MKKGIVILIVLVAVIVLLSPGIIGRIAEESVDENLQRAIEENEDIVVTSEAFDRGWFSSEGRHRIEIRDPDVQDAIRELIGGQSSDGFPALIVDTRLDHGLIPVSSMGREKGTLSPGLGSAVSTMHIEFPDGETFPIPGTIYSDIGLDGVVRANYLLEPGSHEAEAANAEWGSADIEFSSDPSDQRAVVDGVIDSLFISTDEANMTVGKMTFAGNQTPSRFGVMVGDFAMDIASVDVDESGSESVSLGPISIAGMSEIDGDRINGDMSMSLSGLVVPGYGESGFDFAIRFTGFDGAALSGIVEELESVEDDASSDQLMVLLEDDLQRLVAAGFELHFDKFDFTLPQGPVNAKMRFTLPESGATEFDWTNVLLDLDAEADLRVAEEFVDFAMAMNPQAGAVVGMGFLRKNGDVYEMRAEYAKGLLTVNGAPMPIPLGP